MTCERCAILEAEVRALKRALYDEREAHVLALADQTVEEESTTTWVLGLGEVIDDEVQQLREALFQAEQEAAELRLKLGG
jgi:hypothetical protein